MRFDCWFSSEDLCLNPDVIDSFYLREFNTRLTFLVGNIHHWNLRNSALFWYRVDNFMFIISCLLRMSKLSGINCLKSKGFTAFMWVRYLMSLGSGIVKSRSSGKGASTVASLAFCIQGIYIRLCFRLTSHFLAELHIKGKRFDRKRPLVVSGTLSAPYKRGKITAHQPLMKKTFWF